MSFRVVSAQKYFWTLSVLKVSRMKWLREAHVKFYHKILSLVMNSVLAASGRALVRSLFTFGRLCCQYCRSSSMSFFGVLEVFVCTVQLVLLVKYSMVVCLFVKLFNQVFGSAPALITWHFLYLSIILHQY
mgnify:CR=1 FL=1